MKQVYVGPAETSPGRNGANGKSAEGGFILNGVFYPMAITGAFLIGVFAVFVTRYARFQLTGGTLTGENADIWMMVDLALAVAIVISLRSIFRSGGKMLSIAKSAGVVVMLLTMHNLVHLAPGPFSKIFSPVWADQVIAGTKPNSILISGDSFLVGEQPEILPDAAEIALLD